MENVSIVQKYISVFIKITTMSLALVFTLGCCPKEGVERSQTDSSYNYTLDIYNQNAQTPINSLDPESELTLVLNNGTRVNSSSFFQSESILNRYTFYFAPELKDDEIKDIEVRLIDFKNQSINFKSIKKTPFQRENTPIAQNKWDGFFCKLNPIDWILPKANALSCKAKKGSKITWRTGFISSLILFPEDN